MKRRLIFPCLLAAALTFTGAASPKYVALTFDDGPSGKYTQRLLDGLSEREVSVTFFLCGYRLREYPELAQRILEEGHEIGCHGDTHDNMAQMGRRYIDIEISNMLDSLPVGTHVRFLRPPGGCCSEGVMQVAQAKQMPILSWSVDPRDWATSDRQEVEKSVLSKVKDGDVIILHDMTDSSVDAALDIVDVLQQRGFTFLTASELATRRGYILRPGKTYTCFPEREEEPEE